MHAIRDSTRLGGLTRYRRPPAESNTHKERFGTFPHVVHEPPDRTSQLDDFTRTFRNPGCNRYFARTVEGAGGRIAICVLQVVNLFFQGSVRGTLVFTESCGSLFYTAHREARTCRSTVKDEAWRFRAGKEPCAHHSSWRLSRNEDAQQHTRGQHHSSQGGLGF